MLTRKCDVCGREIDMVDAHYRLIFDGGFIRKEKDICISCFNRIKAEVEKPQQADTPHLVKTPHKSRESHEKDTPQTESTACDTCQWYNSGIPCGVEPSVCKREVTDTPQTDCETCKYGEDKHRYAHICNECGVGINNYTPQTERSE